jgi:hypothetical protein
MNSSGIDITSEEAIFCWLGLNAGNKKPYSWKRMIGNARMNAKISAIVVVNGSPIPSVTGLLPSGALERPLIALSSCGLEPASAARVAEETPLPGRSSAPVTAFSWVATTRALCCTV